MAENNIVVGTLKQGENDFYPRTSKELVAGMPSALSDLTADSTHRTVTDAEKSVWNAKYTKPASGIPETDLASAVTAKLNATEIFWATYGTTTYNEIVAATGAGKIVAIHRESKTYVLYAEDLLDSAWFISNMATQDFRIRCFKNDTWASDAVYPEINSNKTSTIAGNESNTNKYPSTKGVADYIASKELSDLADVSDTAPTDGQALLWDGTNEEWKPGTVQGGGGSVTDVTVGGTSVVNQQGVAEVPEIPEVVVAQELSIDSTPTANSANLVTSGGIYNVIGDIESLLAAI